VLTGVVGACAAGVVLGLWARPSDVERELIARHLMAHAPTPPPAPSRKIEIRVDRSAAPPAPQPAATPPAPAASRPPPEAPAAPAAPAAPELMAPKRPPEGLMRVHAVAPVRLEDVQPDPRRDLAAIARKQAQARARALDAQRKADRLEKARLAEAAKARQELARKAEARAQADAQAKKKRLAAEQARAQAERLAEAKAAELAQAKAARAREAHRLAEARSRAQRVRTVPARGEGPMRVAGDRCVSSDPGAALACADPALKSADRELGRAYRAAQAAGVPSSTLERQQQRWLAARAAAAREAPWAVHDVYLARIAELQDQTRRAAHGD
jgi:colicin import membrane protein